MMSIDAPSLFGLIIAVIGIGSLAVFWIMALISISRCSPLMSDREVVVWYAIVIFAPVIGTLVWFFLGRDRYALPLDQ